MKDSVRPLAHALLVAATFLTMVIAGALDAVSGSLVDLLHAPALLLRGVPYAVALMAVLVARELGAVVVLRNSGDAYTLPYFFPAPSLFGTLGTFFTPLAARSRRTLFDAGLASSLCGFVVSVGLVAVGLGKSDPIDPGAASGASIGTSLLFKGLTALLRPEAPDGLMLHPLAFAGWTGLFVTAANLLPIGQLDGGHIMYALVGARQRYVAWVVLAVLALGGVLLGAHMWILWPLILLVIGVGHPESGNDSLGAGRYIFAAVALVVLISAFPLVPVAFVRP